MDKHEALQQYFGHATFRDGQEEVVDAILQGRDVLGIMPTGAGKSVCYQLSAMLLSGLTIVISPLISLMKDQVDSLLEIGISAAYLNSSMDAGEYQVTMLQARQGIYRILYVAPERLQTEGFLSFAEQAEISMVTVDEAHCVSQWGQDFRQSYLGIAEFLNKLQKRPIVSAFTATATERFAKIFAACCSCKTRFRLQQVSTEKTCILLSELLATRNRNCWNCCRNGGERVGLSIVWHEKPWKNSATDFVSRDFQQRGIMPDFRRQNGQPIRKHFYLIQSPS